MTEYEKIPVLKKGVILKEVANRKLLLIPEGYIELDDVSWDILRRCDGVKKLGDILEELKNSYVGDPKSIEEDTIQLLMELKNDRLLDFIP
ncbi:MAG: PqqD family peptide modification chaperone [Hydrogenobacter sp.]